MRISRRVSLALAASIVVLTSTGAGAQTARMGPDGSFQVGGRRLTCENVRTRMDRDLPNLGVAVPAQRLLLINPDLIGRQPSIVQMFVFAHECGHHRVGASELGADCWAVNHGVADGWLSRASLNQICKSFGGRPATPTHPSAQSRCAALDRCFGTAMARHAPTIAKPVQTAAPAPGPDRGSRPLVAKSKAGGTAEAAGEPSIVSQPRLLWSGSEIY